MGKPTPDAFSILLIPETTSGNRFSINEYSFLGKTPFWKDSSIFANGFIKNTTFRP